MAVILRSLVQIRFEGHFFLLFYHQKIYTVKLQIFVRYPFSSMPSPGGKSKHLEHVESVQKARTEARSRRETESTAQFQKRQCRFWATLRSAVCGGQRNFPPVPGCLPCPAQETTRFCLPKSFEMASPWGTASLCCDSPVPAMVVGKHFPSIMGWIAPTAAMWFGVTTRFVTLSVSWPQRPTHRLQLCHPKTAGCAELWERIVGRDDQKVC